MAVSDDFNRADGALGANWANSMGTSAPAISSNKVVGQNASNYGAAHWTANSFSNDHASQIVFVTTNYLAAGVRHATGGNWYGYFSHGEIQKCVGGSVTSLVSRTAASAGQTIGLSVAGTTLTPSLNGTPGATTTDASLSTGAAGFCTYGNTCQGDDWQGTGEVAGGATPVTYWSGAMAMGVG